MDTTTVLLNGLKHVSGFYGAYTASLFWQCLAFALIGHFLVTTTNVATRNVNKPGTPVHFSAIVFIQDNWIRIVRNLILIYLSVRFCPEIFGATLNHFSALCAGAGIDAVFVFISKWKDKSKGGN